LIFFNINKFFFNNFRIKKIFLNRIRFFRYLIDWNREWLAGQRLHDEVGDHPAVLDVHPWAKRVEDPGDPDVHAFLGALK
jgi:hypothetical protein